MDFICVDIGTSSCKACVISDTGAVLRCAKRLYPLQRLQEGWASLELRLLWNAVQDALREIASAAANAKAMMVSSLGETLVMLDAKDRLLFDEGITYLDSRNVEIWKTLEDSLDTESIYQITGKRIFQIASTNQYRWVQQHEPEKLEAAKRILFVDSFVAYMLSGEAGMDYSTASNSLLFDIHRHQWSSELANTFSFDLRLLPRVGKAGSPLGKIRQEMAKELGLPRDVTVLIGCHDQIAAVVGGGALCAGDAVVGEGSTEALNLLIENVDIPKAQKLQISIEPFIDEERYLIMLSRLTHGTCIKWFASDIQPEPGQDVYDMLNRHCPGDSSGVTFLPYLSNTYFNEYTRPMGAFIGLSLGTTRYQAYRALLEGLACETRSMCEELANAGIPFHTLTATGGAAKSEVYMQLKANITQRSIGVLKDSEAGLSGLAMMCAVQSGCYETINEAATGFGISKRMYEPLEDCGEIVRRHSRAKEAILRLYQESSFSPLCGNA